MSNEYFKVTSDFLEDLGEIRETEKLDVYKTRLNNIIEYLNNLEYTIFDNETYYFIEENLIKNNSEKKSKYYIWLSEETPNTEENRELNFYFKINEF